MLEFDEQLSRLQKPDREEMTDEEYAVFNKNVEVMEKNWGFINNLFKILPLNAKEYIGFLNFKNSLYNDTCYLTDAQKEMIGVVVSSYNCCCYCLSYLNHHYLCCLNYYYLSCCCFHHHMKHYQNCCYFLNYCLRCYLNCCYFLNYCQCCYLSCHYFLCCHLMYCCQYCPNLPKHFHRYMYFQNRCYFHYLLHDFHLTMKT